MDNLLIVLIAGLFLLDVHIANEMRAARKETLKDLQKEIRALQQETDGKFASVERSVEKGFRELSNRLP